MVSLGVEVKDVFFCEDLWTLLVNPPAPYSIQKGPEPQICQKTCPDDCFSGFQPGDPNLSQICRKLERRQVLDKSSRDRKTHDSHRRHRTLRFFLREKIQKNPVETAPRNCRFLSLVAVERVLIFKFLTTFWQIRRAPDSSSNLCPPKIGSIWLF